MKLFDLKSSSNAIAAFETAKNHFGNEFIETIKADMAKKRYSTVISYQLSVINALISRIGKANLFI